MKTTKLEKLRACKEAVLYVKTQKSIVSAWQNCERGDWMLWIAKTLNVDDKKLTMAKAVCAKQVEHLMKDQRSKNALQACFDYASGKITREQLDAAADAANAAAVAADAAYAAADAAAYVAYAAADAVAYAAAVADAVAYAADADATDATDAVRISSLKKSADICRKYLTEEVLTKYKKLK